MPILDTLLSPVGFAGLARHWDTAPLHVSGDPARFAPYVTPASVRALSTRTDARTGAGAPFEILAAARTDGFGPNPRVEKHLIPGSAIEACLAAGECVQIRNPHLVDPRIMALLTAIKTELGVSGDRMVSEVFLTPPGRGLHIHWDNFTAIVLQIEGTKRWRVAPRPALVAPLRSADREPDGSAGYDRGYDARNDTSEPAPWEHAIDPVDASTEIELRPGDVLVVPSGTWHGTRTGSERSVSLTVGVANRSIAGLIGEFLTHVLLPELVASPEWRCQPIVSAAGPGVPDTLAEVLNRRLAELARILPGEGARLASWWKRGVARVDAPPWIDDTPLDEHTPLTRSPAAPLTWQASADALTLWHGDQEIVFDDPALRPFAEGLLDRPTFTVAEARGWVPAERGAEVAPMTRTLLDLGVLQVAHA